MRCEDFRTAILEKTGSDEVLSHLRSCEACMNFAIEHDPDLMFRAIGGEMEPPGGAEAFAAEVIQQIHVRETERRFARPSGGPGRFQRWAIAAAAAFTVVTGALFWPRETKVDAPVEVVQVAHTEVVRAPTMVRPVVEKWDSSSAMIIEIPEEETSDLKVVMVFDESLPADI